VTDKPTLARRREERRQKFVDAACRAIRTLGPGVSMEQIAAEAGVSKPIVYRLFRDKSDLHRAVVEHFVGEMADELSGRLQADAPDPERLIHQAIDGYLARIEEEPKLYAYLVQHAFGSASNVSMVEEVAGRIPKLVKVVLGEQLRLRGADSGATEVWAAGIIGMVVAAGDSWARNPVMPRATLSRYLTDLLWLGFEGITDPVERSTPGAAAG